MTRPNFLIVGAVKAGTTSLYRYLRQHPDIFMPPDIKETYYFSLPSGAGADYGKGAITKWEAYTDLFAAGSDHLACGEASGAYLYFYQRAAPRILDHLGADVKIVISLRDPIERAYSDYLHHVREGLEPLSFADALNAAAARRAEDWWWRFQYEDVGYYFEQVKAYVEAFGLDHVHMMPFEDWTRHTPDAMQNLFSFLGVDAAFVPDTTRRYSATGVPRSPLLHSVIAGSGAGRGVLKRLLPRAARAALKNRYYEVGLTRPEMDDTVRNRLADAYRDDVAQLRDLLQRDFSEWSV